MRPYIGIAGFKTKTELEKLVEVDIPGRSLAAGVLVSEESLEGRGVSFRNPNRYPAIDSVPSIWSPGAFGIVHYCSERRFLDINTLVSRCGLVRGMGVQLNLVWPDPDVVCALDDGGLDVILQVNQHTLAEVDFDMKSLAAGLHKYDPHISCLLFDLSRGTGKEFDAKFIESLLDMARVEFAAIGVAVAGGLGPGSVSQLAELLTGPFAGSRRLYLSCDAESRLMNLNDDLDLDKCAAYLKEVSGMFAGF